MDVAAQLVADADVFLLFTGAGFSADSGLATYDDVAKVAWVGGPVAFAIEPIRFRGFIM